MKHFFRYLFLIILFLSVIFLTKAQDAGSLDLTFGGTGIIYSDSGWGRSIAIQDDGKIVVAGYLSNGSNSDFVVIRYNEDGTHDSSFGNEGIVTFPISNSLDRATTVKIQSDGKIVIAGCSDVYLSGYSFSIARLNSNGSFDTNFGSNGIVITTFGLVNFGLKVNLHIFADGNFIISSGSTFTDSSGIDIAVIKFKPDGSIDSTFGNNGKIINDLGYDEAVTSMSIFDNKILIAGLSNQILFLVRYNNNGMLDSTFGVNGVVSGNKMYNPKIAVDSVGKIVVFSTNYYSLVNHNVNFLMRYNANGSIDSSFGINGINIIDVGGSNWPNSIVFQSDGKIIIANSNNNKDFAIIRCNSNGFVDNTFGTDGITNTSILNNSNYCNDIAIQNDGKIVIVGDANNHITYLTNIAVLRYNCRTIGINENIYNYNLNIFPNPTTGIFTVKCSMESSVFSAEVIDILGNIISVSNSLYGSLQFDLSSKTKGIYFIKVKSTVEDIFIGKIVYQ